LGEALASTHPSGKFVGYSAGSTPGTSVFGFVLAEVITALVMVSSTNLTNFKKLNIRALNS